jgi:hypothetical protein
MPKPSGLFRRQYEFAAHIRDPARRPRPADVEERRMAIYRDLFYNNVASLLAGNFPVLRKLLPDEHWHAIIRDFFVKHRCETPFFLELSQEFLEYLQTERETDLRDPPFMLELAHYEWVELALSVSDRDPDLTDTDPNGDLLAGRPRISPLAWNLTYRFPVHRIAPGFQPAEPGPQPTHLVVYRNRTDDVEFLEINAVTQRLLELLKANPGWRGRQVLEAIASELRHPEPARVLEAGTQLLNDLRARGVIVGAGRHDS